MDTWRRRSVWFECLNEKIFESYTDSGQEQVWNIGWIEKKRETKKSYKIPESWGDFLYVEI